MAFVLLAVVWCMSVTKAALTGDIIKFGLKDSPYMIVLSLFDGMSCGRIALQELGVTIERYYASEVDKYAIHNTMHNFPDTVQFGDVRQIDARTLGRIDLLIGGSPCQSFSFAGKRVGMRTKQNERVTTLARYLELKDAGFEFEGQSYLFWEYIRILQEVKESNPNVYFLLENVEMGKQWEYVIDEAIGVKGVHINSALVSAQVRKRIYWTNIRTRQADLFGVPQSAIPQPKDRRIFLKDILEDSVAEKYYLKEETVRRLLATTKRRHDSGSGFGPQFHTDNMKMGAIRQGGRNWTDLIETTEPTNGGGVSHLIKNIKSTDDKGNAFLATSYKGAWANGTTLITENNGLSENFV